MCLNLNNTSGGNVEEEISEQLKTIEGQVLSDYSFTLEYEPSKGLDEGIAIAEFLIDAIRDYGDYDCEYSIESDGVINITIF